MPRPIRATISASALAHNLTAARRHARTRQDLGGDQGERVRPWRGARGARARRRRRLRGARLPGGGAAEGERRDQADPDARGLLQRGRPRAAAQVRADAGDPQPRAGRDPEAQQARGRDRRLPQGEQRHEPPRLRRRGAATGVQRAARASAGEGADADDALCRCRRRGRHQGAARLVQRADAAVAGRAAPRFRSPTRRRCCASRTRSATGCARASCSTAARRSPTRAPSSSA